MTDALMLIGLVAIGVALGWWLKRRTAQTRKRVLQVVLFILGAPIALWIFGSAIQSDTLAALAGFSLMGMTACAVPLAVGVFIGRKLG
jgi:ABC-type amino acid transport system permease subunit